MATIITVHGTNATGPEYGNRWWQRDSPFQEHLRELVKSKDGTLTFRPFVWDGLNSENSRRRSGSRLLALVRQFEANEERYCIVGHSHGGSVIANALVEGASKTNELPHLMRWITIGTPFLSFSNSIAVFNVFPALGIAGKALYVSLVSTFLLLICIILFLAQNTYFLISTYFQVFGILTAPFIVFYLINIVPVIRRLNMYRGKRRLECARHNFIGKWIALRHKSDEALQGLQSLNKLKINIFSRGFAVTPLTYISVFIIPLSILLISASGTLTIAIFDLLPIPKDANVAGMLQNGKLVGDGRYYLVNVVFLTLVLAAGIFILLGKIGIDISSVGDTSLTVVDMILLACVLLFMLPGLIFLVSLFVVHSVAIIARVLSVGLSKILNHMTWQQVRKRILGNDIAGDYAIDAQDCPAWTKTSFAFLPDALGDEISKLSNEAAAKAIAKFREGLDGTAFRRGLDGGFSAFTEYLSWDELIHTCYFDVPRFRKLVAYAISTADGFGATEHFKSDPDYVLVEKWFQEIRNNKQQEAAGETADVPAAKPFPELVGCEAPAHIAAD